MDEKNEPQHISTTDARSGATPHMTRYVLGFGLLAIIVIYAIFLLI